MVARVAPTAPVRRPSGAGGDSDDSDDSDEGDRGGVSEIGAAAPRPPKVLNARPCSACEGKMVQRGIRRCYFTINERTLGVLEYHAGRLRVPSLPEPDASATCVPCIVPCDGGQPAAQPPVPVPVLPMEHVAAQDGSQQPRKQIGTREGKGAEKKAKRRRTAGKAEGAGDDLPDDLP